MGELFDFFARSRHFILFLLLEVLCFYFIINTNNYWSATYFNTSNRYAAKILAWSNTVNEYTRLRQVNAELAQENQRLNQQVTQLLQSKPAAPAAYQADTAFAGRFTFKVAKVLNNTTQLANNYITIDKGTNDGIKPGMAVISPTGLVGKVKVCSPQFSYIISILHSEFLVSAKLVKSKEIGSVKWDGQNPNLVKMTDVLRDKPVSVGDSVVTSGFSLILPPDILIGRVRSVGVQPNQTFHDITVDLTTDFTNLAFVYVIENHLQPQQEQLEKQTEKEK